jgi:hypothetical protein
MATSVAAPAAAQDRVVAKHADVALVPVRNAWPVAQEAAGRWQVVGEVVLTNGRADDVTVALVTVEVLDRRGRLMGGAVYRPSAFEDMLIVITGPPEAPVFLPPGTRVVGPGDRAVALVSLLTLRHLVPVTARITVYGTWGRLSTRVALPGFSPGQEMLWPLAADDGLFWLADATAESVAHRRAVLPLPTGEYFVTQRFAMDPVQIDIDGNISNPVQSPHKEDYYAWGATVRASGSGVVVAVTADQPDQEIGSSDPNQPAGNFVAIEHGPSLFSAYAHMMHGSATVQVGDAVEAGQPLGLVGNSGNTTNPHLHFQYMDRWEAEWGPAAFFIGQGLPPLFWNADAFRIRTGVTYPLNGRTVREDDVVLPR